MELLPSEFIQYAELAGLSKKEIASLIGHKMAAMEAQDGEDLSWRELPPYEAHKEHWKMLKNTPTHLQLQRIARREVLQSYQMFCHATAETITLLGISDRNTIYFETFNTYAEFEQRFTAPFDNYPAPELPQLPIDHLTTAEFDVLTLLIELFIEKYPYPDANWQPQELLMFTSDSLQRIQADSDNKAADASWWQHWKKIAQKDIVSRATIDSGALLLANRGMIGEVGEVEGQALYYIGEALTWLLRSIAWWDRGLVLRNNMQHTEMILLEASALFVLLTENDEDYSLKPVNSHSLRHSLRKYILMSCQDKSAHKTKSQKPKAVQGTATKHKAHPVETKQQGAKINFCFNCGAKLNTSVNFCPQCGQKIK